MIYGVSFLSGAVLMGLEMVGSRILAPVFGSSIFVWGSLIGVVLTALSLGYYAGGYLSDRIPRSEPLSLLLALAGMWTSYIPALSKRILPRLAASLPGIAGPLFASFSLFFAPSILLAMVSPWCMRLLIPSVERAGRSAGLLYAVSNGGSILGTFATSFYLIPRMGSESIVAWAAFVLLGLGITCALMGRSRRMCVLVAVLAATTAVTGGSLPRELGDAGVVYETQSLYHHIYVVDQGNVRLMRFDNAVQGGMHRDSPYDSAYPYVDYFHLALTMKEDIRDVLMIGLGAGMAPKRFSRDYPDMDIQVVEIDVQVAAVARGYFGLPGDDRVKVFVEDGRRFLTRTAKKYDLIVLDAYYADSIPFHLTTVEFYELVREHLKPGGVVASNIIGAVTGPRSKLFRSMHLTLARVLPATYVFPMGYRPGTEEQYRNILVFAVSPGTSMGDDIAAPRLGREDFEERARLLLQERVTIPGFVGMAKDLYEGTVDRGGAALLTDDHAPVDALLHLY